MSKYRGRSNAEKQVIKDLSQLPRLQQMIANANAPKQPPSPLTAVTPIYKFVSTDNISNCILRTMSFDKALTIQEVCERVSTEGIEFEQVRQIMVAMINVGTFHASSTGTGKPGYMLKKVTTEKTGSTKPRVAKVSSDPENRCVTNEKAVSSEVIHLSDGVDRAIWKVAYCAKKPLSCSEFADILFEYGFDKIQIKNRVSKLMFSLKWFNHGVKRGTNGITTYVLKKGIKPPVKEKDVKPINEGIIANEPYKLVDNLAFDLNTSDTEQVTPMISKANDAVVSTTHYPLLPTDGIKATIWKVMKNYGAPLSVSEIETLVIDNGTNPKSVSPRFSDLYNEDVNRSWFTREWVVSEKGKGHYKYSLLSHIELPSQERRSIQRRAEPIKLVETVVVPTLVKAQPPIEIKYPLPSDTKEDRVILQSVKNEIPITETPVPEKVVKVELTAKESILKACELEKEKILADKSAPIETYIARLQELQAMMLAIKAS